MTETTDFISRLVRAANQVETLHHLEAKRLLDKAIRHIEELRAESGIIPIRGRDAVVYIKTVSAGVDRVSREEWHHALLHAAEMIRDLRVVLDSGTEITITTKDL